MQDSYNHRRDKGFRVEKGGWEYGLGEAYIAPNEYESVNENSLNLTLKYVNFSAF